MKWSRERSLPVLTKEPFAPTHGRVVRPVNRGLRI
jgi:hypothetical protein